jgi:hypothetical protein
MNSSTVMAPGPASTSPEAITDVFISYSRADESWVASDLEPWLKENGYQVYRDNQILGGENVVEWIRSKLESCRYVVVVLSPSWVEREWTNHEAMLIQVTDPLAKKKRLVPLLYKPCQIPAAIPAFLQYIDLTSPDPESRIGALKRLIASLPKDTGPAELIADPTKRSISKTRLGDLAHQLRCEEGGRKFQNFKARLEIICTQIGRITEFKVLHDGLHQLLDGPCRMVKEPCQKLLASKAKPPEGGGASGAQPEDLDAGWFALSRAAQDLIDGLEDLINEGSKVSFAANERFWLGRLEAARAGFADAVRERNLAKLRWAAPVILVETDRRFHEYNTRLFEAAEALQLETFMKSLGEVYGLLQVFERFNPDDAASNWLRRLAQARDGLESVGPTWTALVRNHNHLQAIDNLLKISFDETTCDDSEAFQFAWQPVAEELGALIIPEKDMRLTRLRARAEQVEAAIRERNPRVLREAFEMSFRGPLSQAFNKTDQDLRNLCPKLEEAGCELGDVLEMIRDV